MPSKASCLWPSAAAKKRFLAMSRTIRYAFFLFLGVLLTASLRAQTTTSVISGHVADTSGALSEAMVTAVYTPSGVVYHTFANKDGNFRLSGVISGGPYTIKAEAAGHRAQLFQEVYAPLAQTVVVDFMLNVETVTLGEVVVSASRPDVQSDGVGTVVDRAAIEAVPTASRSMNDVMKLTPQGTSVAGGFAVGGGTYRGSMVTVDGATFNDAFGMGSNLPAGGSPISLDAIEQLSISLTPFDVRQSGFQGGAINVVTKQGGNSLHASLYNYFTSSDLQGKRVGENSLAQAASLNNAMGFTLSGPIVKNKVFFFLNAEYTIDNVAGSTRQARADASQPFGGSTSFNRPTVAQMEEMRSYLVERYGYDPGRYQGYSYNTPDYKLLARLDWNINSDNRFNIRFSHTHTYNACLPNSTMTPLGSTNTPISVGGTTYTFNRYDAGRLSDYALYFESACYYEVLDFTSVAAELDSRLFDGKGSNTLRATWSYQNEPRDYPGSLFPTVDILEPYTDETGATQYAMFTTFGVDPITPMNVRRVSILNITDEVSYTAGSHNLVGGLQLEGNHIINGYTPAGTGWYLYDSWDSFTSGAQPLSFMISHANLDDPAAVAYPTFNIFQASLYAQDEVALSPRFDLTAGIRLEVPSVSYSYDNCNKEFAAIAAAHPESSFAGLSTADLPAVAVNVSPRVGFNWLLTPDRRLQLHGGTGLFTGRIPNVWLAGAVGNSNVIQYQYIANYNTHAPVAPFFTDRTDIINSLYAGSPFVPQDLSAPTGATILDKNLRMPTSWKSSLSLDAKLPFDIKGLLEAIYSYNFNEVVATTLGYADGPLMQLPGEPEMRRTFVKEGIANDLGQVLGGSYLHNARGLHGQYLSLSATLSRHFACGLDAMAAYTHSFSQSVTDGVGNFAGNLGQVSTVHGDNAPELGRSAYVIPDRLIASLGYTLLEGRSAAHPDLALPRPRCATKMGLFYEGYNIGFVGSYTKSGISYLMNAVSGMTTSQLIYIPTEEELQAMPFSSDENRQQYEDFIASDRYLSAHRGEYSTRNAARAPWLNRIDFKLDQEFYFYRGSHVHTLQIGADVVNVANLLCSSWGLFKHLSSETILTYKEGRYTFTAPVWDSYNNFLSTWQLLLHLRYSF